MKFKNKILITLLAFSFINISCTNQNLKLINNAENRCLEIFKDTEDYKLAKAVKNNNLKKINSIIQNDKSIIERSYNENYYSVLHFAVKLEREEATIELLKNGFNPNVKNKNGETPLHIAAGFPSIVFYNSYRNTKLIEILLEYGADTESTYSFQFLKNLTTVPTTPLMESIRNSLSMSPSSEISNILSSIGIEDFPETRKENVCLEKTKMLVEEGHADINHKTTYGITASIFALYYGEIEKAHYLIVQKKADITEPFYMNDEDYKKGITTHPVELLRKLVYPLDSEEYKLKLEIIEEFKNQGIDYYSEPVSGDIKL